MEVLRWARSRGKTHIQLLLLIHCREECPDCLTSLMAACQGSAPLEEADWARTWTCSKASEATEVRAAAAGHRVCSKQACNARNVLLCYDIMLSAYMAAALRRIYHHALEICLGELAAVASD